MREIKFRAWDKKNKEMVNVLDLRWEEVMIALEEVNTESYVHFPLKHNTIELMQYTGLKDNNGKEIYEGDIVNFTYWWFDGNEAESNLCGEVVYLEHCMSFGLKHVKNSDWCKHTGADRKEGDTDAFGTWTFDEADFEVIGNIHENPELLNTLQER